MIYNILLLFFVMIIQRFYHFRGNYENTSLIRVSTTINTTSYRV